MALFVFFYIIFFFIEKLCFSFFYFVKFEGLVRIAFSKLKGKKIKKVSFLSRCCFLKEFSWKLLYKFGHWKRKEIIHLGNIKEINWIFLSLEKEKRKKRKKKKNKCLDIIYKEKCYNINKNEIIRVYLIFFMWFFFWFKW